MQGLYLQDIVELATAVPAAGAEFTLTLPAPDGRQYYYKLRSVFAALTATGAANRNADLELRNAAGQTLGIYLSAVNQVDGTTLSYTYAAGADRGASPQASRGMIEIGSEIWVRGGDVIKSLTANIQTGDQWTAARMILERWV